MAIILLPYTTTLTYSLTFNANSASIYSRIGFLGSSNRNRCRLNGDDTPDSGHFNSHTWSLSRLYDGKGKFRANNVWDN
jgi:hypothetical protein